MQRIDFMSGKTTAAIITAVILSASIPSSPSSNRIAGPERSARIQETSLPPDNGVSSSFLINLQDEYICLTEFDSAGTELSKKIIDYINIYSLYPYQLEQLRAGAHFDSREAAAEFIQDLGS